MSEVKDEEEMVEQSSSDSSDDEQLIDAEVGVGESSQPVEKQIVVENGGTPAPPSEATSEDNKNVESAEVEGSAEPSPESNADGATPVDAAVADKSKSEGVDKVEPLIQPGDTTARDGILEPKVEEEVGVESKDDVNAEEVVPVPEENGVPEDTPMKQDVGGEEYPVHSEVTNQTFLVEPHMNDGDESGSEEEQAAFMKELESFFKERSMEFKPPKFYGEGLNCLKLWRGVTRLGGYDRVTACKLWRQVGESFKPPKTCTTVSWSFRIFYEKALLDYERHKLRGGELHLPIASISEPMNAEIQMGGPSTGSGRARRDAAARAMQGWHSQRLLGNGEVGDPIIKDKSCVSLSKREKPLKSVGLLKRKKASNLERTVKTARTMTKVAKPQMDSMVVDIGPPADWVKVNVRKTKDCFEVYALVPGLLREEVRVQSDPAGRLVISGDPEQPDNPWGVAPFKKVISLPSRIDPHQTSAVVTLHGQLFVRVPFEQSDL